MLNYLTPFSRVLLEKLTGFHLVKFPAVYGTQRFITTFTSGLEIWESQPPGSLSACTGIALPLLSFIDLFFLCNLITSSY